MKRTHLSIGIYDNSWRDASRKPRVKHKTACGTIADYTKATEDRTKVTCRLCLKKA